jgi:hypothetical protein
MNLGQSFRVTAAIAACTAVAAQAALAAGEQKNVRPFTASASRSATTSAGWNATVAAERAAATAEANKFDSTRAYAALERYLSTITGTGEAKNEAPFTRTVGRSA